MSSNADGSPTVHHDFPLLDPARAALPIAQRGDRLIAGKCFLAAVERLAERLPACRYVFNLCTDRFHFLLGFAAALSRRQTTLLPPNRAEATVRKIRSDYPDSYALVDGDCPGVDFPAMRVEGFPAEPGGDSVNPVIPAEHLAAVVFTSGSTGAAHACLKTWGLFCRSVDLIAAQLELREAAPHHILATVPAQHMYGLETTILMPLRTRHVVSNRRAFYPADIKQALEALPRPRMLVTTPLHLRACLEGGGPMPAVDLIVSATAPLSSELAAEAETRFGGRLLEIFGFSEAGSVAVRRTACTDVWALFEGLGIFPRGEEHLFSAPYLAEPVLLHDRIERLDAQHFRLLGRMSEQVNIAGKRTSLEALNAALCDIEGVRDGVFFMPERAETAAGVPRLTAFVVAPGLTVPRLLAELRGRIDAAFLPRPLVIVDALPRLENGKLRREDLERLAQRCRQRGNAMNPP